MYSYAWVSHCDEHFLLNLGINKTVNDHVGLFGCTDHSWSVNILTSRRVLFNTDCTTSVLHNNPTVRSIQRHTCNKAC